MMRNIGWVGIVGVTVVLLGCQGGTQAAQEGIVVAEVNRSKITVEDFKREMAQVPPYARALFQSEAGQKEFLEDLVVRELIFQEASKQGLDKSADVQKRVEAFRRRVLLEALLKQEIEGKASVTEDETKSYYQAHRDEFKAGEALRASHVLVKTEKEAKAVLDRLGKGESFKKLAQTLSVDPGSKAKGGDLGFFSRGQMVPAFEKVAFGLKPGETSGIVQTSYGYHIIKVTGKKEGKPQAYEEVARLLRQRLMREKQKAAFETWVQGLKAQAKIVMHPEELKALRELGPEPEGKSEPEAKGEKPTPGKDQGK